MIIPFEDMLYPKIMNPGCWIRSNSTITLEEIIEFAQVSSNGRVRHSSDKNNLTLRVLQSALHVK